MGAQFKGLEVGTEEQQGMLSMETIEQSHPLFDDFDPNEQGGLGVTPDGQVFEVRHPYWATNDPANIAHRAQLLPIRVIEENHRVVGFEWLGPQFDPTHPSLGSESELATMHGSTFHRITPDSVNAVYPDGTTESLAQAGWDPEAVQTMVEFKSEPAYGFAAHRRNVIDSTYQNELRLESHHLNHAGLALYPEDYHREDTWSSVYAQKVLGRMRAAREFGAMSDQLHVQILTPEAAMHAMNKYQAVQAVVGLITAAAPIRDGSFDTTIGQHYRLDNSMQEKIAVAQAGDDFPDPHLDEHDYLRHFASEVPYDWRELARLLGSGSSGALEEATPVDLLATLQRADKELRDASLVSCGRVFGVHADRLRLDLGTIEVMNMGPAGGNLYKKLAAQELVSKYLVALQLEYLQMTPAERTAERELYQTAVDVGHLNNMLISLEGRDPSMRLRDQHMQSKTPKEMLWDMIAIADRYSPVEVSEDAMLELFGTLSSEHLYYGTVDDTFAAYFRPDSPMNATDALRHAHQLEPDIPPNQLLERFAQFRRLHVYCMHERMMHEQDGAPYHGNKALGLLIAYRLVARIFSQAPLTQA